MNKKNFNDLLGRGDLKAAIESLPDSVEKSSLLGRLAEVKRLQMMGLVSFETVEIQLNRIRAGAIEVSKDTVEEPDDDLYKPFLGTAETMPVAVDDSNAVTGLEQLLAQPRLQTTSRLVELAARLTDVAEWLEAYDEDELSDLAGEFRSLARTANKNRLEQQAGIFQEATELCGAAIELTLALREPSGTEAIINKGKAAGSTEEEILTAAKAISKGRLKEVKLVLSEGTNMTAARIKARKLLQQA